ncbi:helix-hairpin-helix domain-containing protein [Flavicella sp.]|uniref:ComEA family DNA-binding protein n=1 Tax=Flavicella sp. TaxID=2957742 RepID=UPI0030192402
MKKLKPHFLYNKKQRNGVFCFLLILVLLQLLYVFISKNSNSQIIYDSELTELRDQIDSLKLVKNKFEHIYKFNPNYITDEKGYALGLSVSEIDRLLLYRGENKWVNSKEEFQKVTQVSDSLLNKLTPFFKFPLKKVEKIIRKKNITKKTEISIKYDINKATESQLKEIYGIGEKLSARIIKYRNRLHGFSFISQLDEVYGLQGQALENLKFKYKIVKPPVLEKININTASFKEVLSIVYLNYEATKLIFQYKDSVMQIEKIEEIKKIEGFSIDKYDRIALYLHAE